MTTSIVEATGRSTETSNESWTIILNPPNTVRVRRIVIQPNIAFSQSIQPCLVLFDERTVSCVPFFDDGEYVTWHDVTQRDVMWMKWSGVNWRKSTVKWRSATCQDVTSLLRDLAWRDVTTVVVNNKMTSVASHFNSYLYIYDRYETQDYFERLHDSFERSHFNEIVDESMY